MIEISMQTALIIYTISFIFGSILMFSFKAYSKNKSIDYFLIFFLISTLGSLLIFFRGELNSTFISVIIANFLLVIANMILIFGITILLDRKPSLSLVITAVAIYFTCFIYFTYINTDVVARVYVFSILIILIVARGLHHLYVFHRTNKDKELLTTALVILEITIILRFVNLLINQETSTHFLSFEVDPIFVALQGISYLLVLVGLFSIISNKANRSLKESERSKASLLSNLPGFAYRCDNDQYWTMRFLSDGFKSVTGYEIDDIIENNKVPFNDLIVEEFRDDIKIKWDRALKNKEHFTGEYQITTKDNEIIWVWEQGIAIFDDNDNCVALEGFITNINSRKLMQKNLEFLSYRDSLTSLYNRRFMEEQITRLEKSRNLPISVIVSDINGLKFINDSFGHDHGDQVIKSAAEVFKRSLRGYELISRLGGDEFLIILENTSNEDCQNIANRIMKETAKEEYKNLGLSISLGFATKISNDQTIAEIRKQAEDFMYVQKIYSKPSTRRKAVDAVVKTLYEKDELSEQHSQSVAKYSILLAKELNLDDSKTKQLETAALLHDVGKIIISDSILKSPGRLTDEEYEQMKKHPEIGYRILSSVPELVDIADIILAHHERIDGKGYPNGLKGENIPKLSRIISICDAFDAMVNIRLYKPRYSKERAIQELIDNQGTQFDEAYVKAFIKALEKEK